MTIRDDGMLQDKAGIGGGYVRGADARVRVLKLIEKHLTPEFLAAFDWRDNAEHFDVELGTLCNRLIKAPDRR